MASSKSSSENNPTEKKAPAKKAAEKKAPAKKAAEKKAPAKKAPAKKAAEKKAPAKKAAEKKAPAKKAPIRRATAQSKRVEKPVAGLSDIEQLMLALEGGSDKGSKTNTAPRRSAKNKNSSKPKVSEKGALAIAIVTVVASVAAVGLAIFRRQDSSSDARCSKAVADVRALISSQPDKEALTDEQLNQVIASQGDLRTYCAYNEADQVISQEILPWLGVTIPTSLPTETTLPGSPNVPGSSSTTRPPIGG